MFFEINTSIVSLVHDRLDEMKHDFNENEHASVQIRKIEENHKCISWRDSITAWTNLISNEYDMLQSVMFIESVEDFINDMFDLEIVEYYRWFINDKGCIMFYSV